MEELKCCGSRGCRMQDGNSTDSPARWVISPGWQISLLPALLFRPLVPPLVFSFFPVIILPLIDFCPGCVSTATEPTSHTAEFNPVLLGQVGNERSSYLVIIYHETSNSAQYSLTRLPPFPPPLCRPPQPNPPNNTSIISGPRFGLFSTFGFRNSGGNSVAQGCSKSLVSPPRSLAS